MEFNLEANEIEPTSLYRALKNMNFNLVDAFMNWTGQIFTFPITLNHGLPHYFVYRLKVEKLDKNQITDFGEIYLEKRNQCLNFYYNNYSFSSVVEMGWHILSRSSFGLY